MSVLSAPPVVSSDLARARLVLRGLEAYPASFAAMRTFTETRTADTANELWLVEHPPVFTLGLGADPAHVLAAHDIPVVQTDRGGEVTYHGPGQAIVYLLMDLRRDHPRARLFAREFVTRIEQAVIDTLAQYGLRSVRRTGAPGIYLPDDAPHWAGAKIAALGLKVRGSGCTYHGVSLNVDMDLRPFSWINPCGYQGLTTIDMRSLGVDAPMPTVRLDLAQRLQDILLPPSSCEPLPS